MKKFRKWLQDSFLPMWAKETVFAENKELHLENERLREKIGQMQAYTDGLEYGMRSGRKIIINATKDVGK